MSRRPQVVYSADSRGVSLTKAVQVVCAREHLLYTFHDSVGLRLQVLECAVPKTLLRAMSESVWSFKL